MSDIWFSFLVHPRTDHDILMMPGGRLLREHSRDHQDFIRKATTMEPVVAGDVVFGSQRARGELIGVVRTPEQLLRPGGRAAVHDAVHFAIDRGSRVVGLGALTAPVTVAGRSVARELSDSVVLTTGNAFTAIVARDNVAEAALGIGSERPLVAVIGATGSVGAAASRLLHDAGFPLLLIGRTEAKVRGRLPDLAATAEVSADIASAAKASVVLVVTSASGSLIGPEDLADGTAVVDMTQPTNIDAADPGFRAKGIRIAQGGLVNIPKLFISHDIGLPPNNTAFACLAETYLLACEGFRRSSIGHPEIDFCHKMDRISRRHGVRPLPLDFSSEPAPSCQTIRLSA